MGRISLGGVVSHSDSISGFMVSMAAIVLLFFVVWIPGAWAQVDSDPELTSFSLPQGFSGLMLGDSFEDVSTLLLDTPYFLYRGEPDVHFLSDTNQTTIVAAGREYVTQGLFQFVEEELHIITLFLNSELLDYYTMYITLSGKYGDPIEVNPEVMKWKDEKVQLLLEKPLTLKYIKNVDDDEVFSLPRQSRDDFLQEF